MVDRADSDEPQPDAGLGADLWHAGESWNQQWQQRHQDLPDVLYHYTDAAGVLGIIRSRELWASHAAFVNDSTEINYLKRVLDRVRVELSNQYEQAIVQTFLRQVDDLFHDLVVSRYNVYLVCFCENGDQLSQWRGYPSAGGGYAIGFHRGAIGDGRFMRKVIYDEKDQREILLDVLMPSCEYLAASTELTLDDEYLRKCLALACEMTLANVADCSCCFKHHGFHEERECRLIRLSAEDHDPPARVSPEFRATSAGLLPYTPLAIRDEGEKPPIAEIVVGPSRHPDLAASAAQQLLKSAGYKNAHELVRHTDVPLRV